nr:hypothetical protein Iba_chr02cCG11530 [Ipomoea batatas]
MPSFSLGLTPPLGEEATWANVVNISSQYQVLGAAFLQVASPSSERQEEEQREVDVVLEERGDGVEIVSGGGEREERIDVQVGEGSLLDKGKEIVVDDGDKAPEIQKVENQDTNLLEGERRSRKITVTLRSPYMVRQINVAQFLTATEKVFQE